MGEVRSRSDAPQRSKEAKLSPHHGGMKEGTPCGRVPDTRRISVSKTCVPTGGLQRGDGPVGGCRRWLQNKGQLEMPGQLPIGTGGIAASGAPGLKHGQHSRLDLAHHGPITVARHDQTQEEKVAALQSQRWLCFRFRGGAK